MKEENEFNKHLRQLLSLIKKLMRSQKRAGQYPEGESIPDLSSLLDKKSLNLNLCFFTFLPMMGEEWEDLESEFLDTLAEGENLSGMDFELSASDLEFLRKHGLRF